MGWLYVQYRKITPGDLMQNQEKVKSTYKVEEPIEILFDQMERRQESAIAGNSPFYDWQLADMGVEISLRHRNIHMGISCGRLFQPTIAHECG